MIPPLSPGSLTTAHPIIAHPVIIPDNCSLDVCSSKIPTPQCHPYRQLLTSILHARSTAHPKLLHYFSATIAHPPFSYRLLLTRKLPTVNSSPDCCPPDNFPPTIAHPTIAHPTLVQVVQIVQDSLYS